MPNPETGTMTGPCLHWFLFEVADEPETTDEVLSVEVVDDCTWGRIG